MSAEKAAAIDAATDTERTTGTDDVTEKSSSDFVFYLILVATLALVDITLSIYYYRNQDGFDMRWILAAMDVSIVLAALGLMGRRVGHFLTSMKLALTLLFVVAILSIIGTWLPQGDKVVDSGWPSNPLYSLYKTLGLFDVYHSRWFLAILFLLGFNLIFCITKRLPTTVRHAVRPRVDVKDVFIRNQPESTTVSGAGDKGLDSAVGVLSHMRYRVHRGKSGSVLAEKGRFSGIASLAFHLSFLFIGVGAMLGAVFGFDETVEVRDGQTVKVPGTNMTVTNYQFDVKYSDVVENGRITGQMPTEYSSDIEVFADGQSLERRVITVNGPLRVSTQNSMLAFLASLNVNYHQASYFQSDRGVVSVLQVNEAPGKALIYTGFVLMMAGISFTLYFPHRRIWLKAADSGDLLMGGRTNRAKVTFQRDFERLTSELRVRLGQEASTNG